MRIDLALKYLCILKSRSSAKHLCEDSAILVNDLPAKPSTAVHSGDKVTIRFPARTLAFVLVAVPEKQLSRAVAPAYYQAIANVRNEDD